MEVVASFLLGCLSCSEDLTYLQKLDIAFQMGYKSSMKVKTSITLSEDILQSMDKILGGSKNRSAFIEAALREYLARRARKLRDRKDLEIINKYSNRLNREAEDVLSYQVEL
jgi:Arc/MetJ family transcription regulator